jgi:hypothetical protein
MTRPTPRAIAIHEAGHAVVARLVGAVVTHITFTPDAERFLGYCGSVAPHGVTLRPSDWAAIYYAGVAAAKRVDPSARLYGCDLGGFEQNLLKGGGPAERVMQRVEEMVTEHWEEIERLAMEIERCNGLYTEELEAMGYWRPAPEPVARDSALARALRAR